jgi:hypothetical protein
MLDEHGAEELNQRPRRKPTFPAWLPNRDAEPQSFEPDGIALLQKAVGAFSPASPQEIHRPKRGAPKSSNPQPSPKKVDTAVAWLRTELAAGERKAAEVEANALSVGIAPRTYDRARQRLGITSRRVGFGRLAKYMIALPAVDGTPSQGANMAGAT